MLIKSKVKENRNAINKIVSECNTIRIQRNSLKANIHRICLSFIHNDRASLLTEEAVQEMLESGYLRNILIYQKSTKKYVKELQRTDCDCATVEAVARRLKGKPIKDCIRCYLLNELKQNTGVAALCRDGVNQVKQTRAMLL